MEAHGAAHPHPQTVADPLFHDSAFFDPNDLVQVKYEMLRSVEKDGRAVAEAAEAFGVVPTGLLCDARFVRPRGSSRAVAPQTRTEAPAQAHGGENTRPPRTGCARGRTYAKQAQSWPRCWPNAAASAPIPAASCDDCFRI